MGHRKGLLRDMRRRSLMAAGLSAAALTLVGTGAARAEETVRIGYVVSKTGQNSAGANTTTIPNYELWVHDVNAAGGLKMPDGSQRQIEVIAYDDRSQTEDVVRGIERLARQDKVDFILPPWGTGFNLAVAPLMARFGYPQLAGTSVVPTAEDFAARWPMSFWLLGSAEGYTGAVAEVLENAAGAGTINRKVAMIAIADGFGIELSTSARETLTGAGFELVMDKTYPLGTQDFGTLISEAEASGADTFLAYSYPGDTFGMTKQAQLAGYNPKVFYTGVGTNFPVYPQIMEGKIAGTMSLGGIDAESAEMQAYLTRHEEVLGKKPDAWASAVIYASLQMLAQSIERQGLDRAAVSQELASGTFDTILGSLTLEDNQLKDLFYLGQWQDGLFKGVAPMDKPGAVAPVIPKPDW